MIRLIFVLIGIGFSVSLNAYLQEIIPANHRYMLISLGSAIGSQVIGGGSSAISLWVYQKTHLFYSPALYLACVAFLALIGPLYLMQQEKRALLSGQPKPSS